MPTSRGYPASVDPGIPRLEAAPKGWSTARIGELVEVVERPIQLDPDRLYTLVLARRSRGGIGLRGSRLGKQIRTKTQFETRGGDFLISRRQIVHGACGVVPPSLNGAIVSGEYTVLQTNRSLLAEFLALLTATPYVQRTFYHSSVGVHVEKMVFRHEQWLGYSIHFPPLGVQRAIVSTLAKWDRAITAAGRLRALALRRKVTLMHQLLSGNWRFRGFDGEPLREAHLGELFSEREETGRPDLPLLAITADRGVVHRDRLARRDTSNVDKSKYLRIAPGDIGYNTMRMWQGVSALSAIEGIVSPAYTVCIPGPDVHGPFFAQLFKLRTVVHLFHRHSQGLVDDTLNLKFPLFSRIKVRFPSLAEQEAIARLLTAMDSEMPLLERLCDALSRQRRGLADLLLTGKVRIPE